MKTFAFHEYILRYVIYFILLGLVQSGLIPSRNSISLYNANDKVTVLTSQNFSSTVYQSKTAWLVEFYASWCGHCQSYAKIYREIGIDIWGWRTVVRIAAINCYAEDNNPICDQHSIRGYPTLRLIEPQTASNTSKVIVISATDAKGVEGELIKQLDALHRKDEVWPTFTPIDLATLDDLYAHISSSIKLSLLIVEQLEDFTGRQIMLDFSKYYEQLAIFRTASNVALWHQLQMNITDIPALFVCWPNRTVEQIKIKQNITDNIGRRNLFNYAIRTFIHKHKSIENFDDQDLEEIILSQNALKQANTQKKAYQEHKDTNDHMDKNPNHQKVHMVDLEIALSYMLRREIPRLKEIQGENYDALIHWLIVLTKYFPGREPVVVYLRRLLSKVKDHSNGLTGKQFQAMANINTSTGYLPTNQVSYQHCAGSLPQYRGYPCALWLLFHTLTVAQFQSESNILNIAEIPSAIKNYIKHFFGCRHCSENFMNETSDINQLDSKNKYEAMIYLWKIHNHVNKRLHDDSTEDPKYPKVQFPSAHLCSNCHSIKTNSENEFDLSNTIDFLQRFYAKENIDFSSLENFSITKDHHEDISPRRDRQASLDRYSMLELNNQSMSDAGIFGFLPSILRHGQFYFFIAFVIILIFARRRYCKSKRKRYTL